MTGIVNVSFMEKREERIVDAAIRVFSRYGVKRTTMNDIAGEAGIVRQTLYNAFANKDEVLRAAIRLHTDRSVAAIKAGSAEATDLGDTLDILFEHMVVRPYELINATPHADDIVSGFNDAAREEIAVAGERYRALIESLLVSHAKEIRALGLTTHQLADFVQRSAVGCKHDARNKKHLLELLASLKVLVLKAVDSN